MKSYTDYVKIRTRDKREIVNITFFVEEFDGQRSKRILMKVIGE